MASKAFEPRLVAPASSVSEPRHLRQKGAVPNSDVLHQQYGYVLMHRYRWTFVGPGQRKKTKKNKNNSREKKTIKEQKKGTTIHAR